MNFLEICGIIFLAIVIINAAVGIFAIRTAMPLEEEVKVLQN
jgi:hypothetical protein